jgi:hypothetical protein
MKVTLGRKNYIVIFKHFICGVTSLDTNKKKQRYCTNCLILEDKGKDKDRKIIGKGQSRRNPIDKLNKNLGKAKALESALRNMPTDRKDRTIFWIEFHKEFTI